MEGQYVWFEFIGRVSFGEFLEFRDFLEFGEFLEFEEFIEFRGRRYFVVD